MILKHKNLLKTGILLFITLQSCGIAGIHFNVHNPKKPGKLPDFSQETVLLGELTKFRSCFDVYYYDLSVQINHKLKSLKGKVDIYATAISDFDTFQIDLHPNFNITELKDLNSGTKLNFKRIERGVFIAMKQLKGTKFSISVAYDGKPLVAEKPPWKGGFVWKKDRDRHPWIGVACESEGASIWWPLKDHTSDEPDSMRMHYTVPEGLTAVGNGNLESESTENGQTTFNWFVSYPINTYNTTIYVGKFIKQHDTYTSLNGETVNLDYYVLRKNEEIARDHFKQVVPILTTYEELYGGYPWIRDGFKLIESPYAGMEHQTAIAYGNGYKNDFNNTDYIILHEIAHEWWGNSISAADLADVWIQEGFATYSEALYFEKTINSYAYDSHLLLYRWFIKNKFPVVGIENRRWFHYKKSSDVYVKGAWILRTLREHIENDDLFFDIIKSFYSKYQYQTVTSQDFINVVNEKTKDDYSWFFNQYLHRNESPMLEHSIDSDGVFYYKWSNVNSDFKKLKIALICGDNDYIITPSTEIQKIQLSKGKNNEHHITLKRNVLFADKENKQLSYY